MKENLYTYKIFELLRVYDGDTITVTLDLGMDIYVVKKIRLFGINTPELKQKTREAGLVSKAYTKDTIEKAIEEGKDVYIKTIKDKTGKYGRLLGLIYIEGNNVSINEQLIDNKLAIPYMSNMFEQK